MIQDSNAPSDMQPWVRQTESEMQELKDKVEKLNSESTQGVSPVDSQTNSSLQDTFNFIPREDGTLLTQANAIDFVGDITSSASVRVDGSITVGEKSEFIEGPEGIEVTGSAPYFEVSPGAVEVNPVTGKQFSTPGTFNVNDTSFNINAYGQIAGNGLAISLSNDSFLMGYFSPIVDVTSGVIYRQGSNWVEGDPEDEIPVTIYEIALADIYDISTEIFTAGTYVDVEGIDPTELNIINGLISEVDIDEVNLKLYIKIEGDNSAFTYVSGGQVSLNSPSQKYESAVSVSGPAANNHSGSTINQYGVFVGPNGGNGYEAQSFLSSTGLMTPTVIAKDKLVVSETTMYVQSEEPTDPLDGDLWVKPDASAEVWEVSSKLTATDEELQELTLYVDAVQDQLNFAIAQKPISHNYVLNSAFDIWQRGTSFTYGATIYSADRWRVGRTSSVAGGTTTISTTVPTGFDYSTFVQRDSGNTSTNALILSQPFESAGKNLRGKTVTLSFYALRGTAYSASSNLIRFGFNSASVAPEAVAYASGGLFLGSNAGFNSGELTATLSTSWQRFSGTFTIPTDADAFLIYFRHSPTGTATSGDFFRVTGVQLEEGSVATPFKKNSGNIQSELAACQRYYQSFTSSNTTVGFGHGTTTTNVRFQIPTTVQMRAAPTMTFTDLNWIGGATGAVVSSASANQSSAFGVTANATVPAVSVNTVYIMRSDSMTLEAEI